MGTGTNAGNLWVKLGLDRSNFTSGLKSAQQETGNFGGVMKNALGTMVGFAGYNIAGSIVGGLKSAVSAGIEYNATLENSSVAWTTLLGSQEKATAMLSRINDFAAKTPFEKMQVDQMAKYLNNAGMAGDDLFGQLTKIGDMGGAFNIQGDSLVELTRQYSQVKQAGVAYTEDLNILADRGVPIYKALAAELNINVAEVKKWASEGKISADIYQKAMDGIAAGVAGGMDKQSQAMTGMLNSLKDNLGQLAGIAAQDIFANLKGGLTVLIQILGNVTTAFGERGIVGGIVAFRKGLRDAFGAEQVAGVIGFIDLLTGLGLTIKGLITGDESALWDGLTDWLKLDAGLADVLTKMFLGVHDSVVGAFGWVKDNFGLIKDAVVALVIAFTSYKAIIMAATIIQEAQNIASAISIARTNGLAFAQGAMAAKTTSASIAQWALNVAMNANPIGVVIGLLAALGFAIYEVVKHWKDICEWIEKAWNWLKKWNQQPMESKSATTTLSSYTNQLVGHNAAGTDHWRGGLSWVNEEGGELMNLPNGTQIIPHDVSMEYARNAAKGGRGKGNQNINIYGTVNMQSQGDAEKTLQDLQFLAGSLA